MGRNKAAFMGSDVKTRRSAAATAPAGACPSLNGAAPASARPAGHKATGQPVFSCVPPIGSVSLLLLGRFP